MSLGIKFGMLGSAPPNSTFSPAASREVVLNEVRSASVPSCDRLRVHPDAMNVADIGVDDRGACALQRDPAPKVQGVRAMDVAAIYYDIARLGCHRILRCATVTHVDKADHLRDGWRGRNIEPDDAVVLSRRARIEALAAFRPGAMIVAIPRESAGVARIPSLGKGPSERIVTQPPPALAGRVKEPVKVAPDSSMIRSPASAMLSAACRSRPAATWIVCCFSGGIDRSTLASGGIAALAPDAFVGQKRARMVCPPTELPTSVSRTCFARVDLCVVSQFSKTIDRFGSPGISEIVASKGPLKLSISASDGRLPRNGTPMMDTWSSYRIVLSSISAKTTSAIPNMIPETGPANMKYRREVDLNIGSFGGSTMIIRSGALITLRQFMADSPSRAFSSA